MKTGVHQPQRQTRRPQVLPTAAPRCAGTLSQITFNGPGCLSFSYIRKASEVLELLSPSSSIHSTAPVSRHTAE